MMDKVMKNIIWVAIIAPAFYLAFAWNTIPETIAMHFNKSFYIFNNINGNADLYKYHHYTYHNALFLSDV